MTHLILPCPCPALAFLTSRCPASHYFALPWLPVVEATDHNRYDRICFRYDRTEQVLIKSFFHAQIRRYGLDKRSHKKFFSWSIWECSQLQKLCTESTDEETRGSSTTVSTRSTIDHRNFKYQRKHRCTSYHKMVWYVVSTSNRERYECTSVICVGWLTSVKYSIVHHFVVRLYPSVR
jgi:hypothetical protein